MSTRGIIARKTKDGWEGVCHHRDSYPTMLGKTIWDLIHNRFNCSVDDFLRYAIEEHPGGWSHIFDSYVYEHEDDLMKKPEELKRGPQCYCHGYFAERDKINLQELDLIRYPDCIKYPQGKYLNCLSLEWVYIIDPETKEMEIWHHYSTGEKFIVHGRDEYNRRYRYESVEYDWLRIITVRLDGEEPEWDKIMTMSEMLGIMAEKGDKE